MKINEIQINSTLGDTPTIGLLQLKSPFFDQMAKVAGQHGWTFAVTGKNAPAFVKRIDEIAIALKQIEEKHMDLDILVLPEYAFLKQDGALLSNGKCSYDLCKEFAIRTNIIVVGNYYDLSERASVSFVIVPRLRCTDVNRDAPVEVFSSKYCMSTYDDDVLTPFDKRQADASPILRFIWQPSSQVTPAYFQVLTCKDYLFFTGVHSLREWPDIIRLDMPGIIICPMCTPEIKTFEARALALLRDIDIRTGEKSIISCFCNPTAVPGQELGGICGDTQVVCPIDLRADARPILRKGVQGLLIVSLNPFKALSKPTPINERESNAVMLSSRSYEFLESSKNEIALIGGRSSRKHTSVVINPIVLGEMGLKKVYGFLRANSYHETKAQIRTRFGRFQDLSIAIHGIYGIHDLMTSSWEEYYERKHGRDLLKMRLWPMIREEEFTDDRFGFCVVERFLKFRGRTLMEYKPADDHMREMLAPGFRRTLREIVLGENVDGTTIEQYKRSGVLLETQFDLSDRSEREKSDGKIEFLILLKLFFSDSGPQATGAKDYFEKWVLGPLAQDDRMRTISRVNTEGEGFLDTDYIIHFVGDLADLNEVVIGKIHTPNIMPESGIRITCGSRVVIPAECLAHDRYPALMEVDKSRSTEPNVCAFISEWKRILLTKEDLQSAILSAIYLVDDETARTVLQTYYLTDHLLKGLLSRKRSLMNDFYSFSYAVCIAIGGVRVDRVIDDETFLRLSRDFVIDLAAQIEVAIREMFKMLALRLELDDVSTEKLVNSVVVSLPGFKMKNLSVERIEIGTAGIALMAIHAVISNEKSKKSVEDTIGKEVNFTPEERNQLIAAAKKLKQSLHGADVLAMGQELKDFAKVRNLYAHSEEGKEISHTEVLQNTFKGLRFLDRLSKIAS